jgi:hypothetical protein
MLQEALNDVVTSAEFLVAGSGDETRKADPALWKEMEGNIGWRSVGPDPVADKIAAAIKKIKTICRPILEGNAT